MVFRIVIAGASQCQIFAEMCLVADHLEQNLPSFCYERIEKPVGEWKAWLCKINQKNKWHHLASPLIWKELLNKGSKPYYIGGASEFLDYCHSYYQFDKFFTAEKFEGLIRNYKQYQIKVSEHDQVVEQRLETVAVMEKPSKSSFVVCISGAGYPLTMYIISGLLNICTHTRSLSKIFMYDAECPEAFLEFVEHECNYLGMKNSGKVVKYVEKIGSVLTYSDLLIILDHIPFEPEAAIGDWLCANKKLMEQIALTINASASRNIRILFPNVGPACFNATVLMNSVRNINKNNIVVATSDLGLDITTIAAEIAQVPMKNMFCPPVWGFVGINHLVDIRTTLHKYDSFEPYERYVKVKNSTLTIGSLTPKIRTMEYLLYFDDTLWTKVAERKMRVVETQTINKAIVVVNAVKLWLMDPNPDYIVNLGIRCNGSFGLNFKGAFSQPAQFIDGEWTPATNHLLPRDSQLKLKYLDEMAERIMKIERDELPNIIPRYPFKVRTKYIRN